MRIQIKRNPLTALDLWFYLVAAGIYLLVFAYPTLSNPRAASRAEMILDIGVMAIVGVMIVRVVLRLKRTIILGDDYISYRTWFGRTKVYPYSAIVDSRTVVATDSDRRHPWNLEDAVTLMFADGRTLPIPAGTMEIDDIRKFIEGKIDRRLDPVIRM